MNGRDVPVSDRMILLFLLSLIALFIGASVYGAEYYVLAHELRPDHPKHAMLAPGGGIGLSLGFLGTGLMVAMLSYTIRKKLAKVTWLGPLSGWLRFHIVCGIMGPMFILLHGGVYMPRGIIAIAFWCMILVALSGVFGRYVYGFLPKLANGKALAWDEAMARLADLRAALVAATAGSRDESVGLALAVVQDFHYDAASVGDLLPLNREVARRRTQIRELLGQSDLSAATQRSAFATLDDQLRLKRGLESSRVAYRMFRYWHLFHRPLASAMYVIVSLHVLLAIMFGNSLGKVWVFWSTPWP